MTVLSKQRLEVTLDVDVTVEWPSGDPDGHTNGRRAGRALLDAALADRQARTFFFRQAAVMPFADWPGGRVEQGLEWLHGDPQHLAWVIARLSPEDRTYFGPVLNHSTDGELDEFYNSFRARYLGLKVMELD